ncbi:MAG: rRNA maturation RNase YbeY [Acidobacteria bacterium]|nr:rRNA maturation RNase YbeY [Acidobacteriota bacterium]
MSKSEKMIVPEIIFRDDLPKLPEIGSLTEFLRDVSGRLELPGSGICRMEVVLTNNEEIQQLNRDYRNLNQVTDVLSFPDGDILPETDEIFLGSVVISVERAEKQSGEIGHSLGEELKFLLLHGLLHLLGYDHEEDDGEMVVLQRNIKDALSAHFSGGE